MQGTQDMTLDMEQAMTSRTTAAGLETWLSGAHTESADLNIDPPVAEIQAAEPAATAESATAGPVNAAEALALSLTEGTFSSARKLTGPDGAELVVDPDRNTYHFESSSLKPLAALLEKPAFAWTPIYSEALKSARATHPAQSLERLRWYAGLIATPGILCRKLSRTERYKLSRWPETEREFPKHFRIAKEMLKGTATVDEIVTASGMSYEEVVDYINASYAAGRLEWVPTARVEGAAPTTSSRRERLIARLNKPLFVR